MKIAKRAVACFIVVLFIVATVWGAWDKDKPAAGTSLRSSIVEMLANNTALQTAFDAEHDFGDSTQTGSHTPGSARAFFQDAAPTAQVDGGAFAATDLGSLWFDTNASPDNLCYVLTATTPTWTKLSVSLLAEIVATANTWGAHQSLGAGFDLLGSTSSDINFGSGNFTVDGATGDTVVGGTLNVTGIATLGDGSLATTQSAADNSAKLATTEYADRKEATLVTQATASIFGTRTFNNTVAGALVHTTIYQSQCDGFLTISRLGDVGDEFTVYIEQGDSSPDIVVALVEMNANQQNAFTVPIRKDDYVQVALTSGSSAITYMSFVPIGTGGLVAQ